MMRKIRMVVCRTRLLVWIFTIIVFGLVVSRFGRIHEHYASRFPWLRSAIEEASRLNELVAYTQYKCRRKHDFPSATGNALSVCEDRDRLGVGSKLLSCSGYNGLATFEEAFASYAGAPVFVVQLSRDLTDPVRHVSQVSPKEQDLTVSDQGPADLTDIVDRIRPIVLRVSIAKEVNPVDLRKSLFGTKFRPTHFILQFGIDQTSTAATLHAWHDLLMDLYLLRHYVSYDASQRGFCGAHLTQCRYSLSFMLLPHSLTPHMAPVVGLGFPDEEHHRLSSCLTGEIGYIYDFCNSVPISTVSDSVLIESCFVSITDTSLTSDHSLPNGCRIAYVGASNSTDCIIGSREREYSYCTALNYYATTGCRQRYCERKLTSSDIRGADILVLHLANQDLDYLSEHVPDLKNLMGIALVLRMHYGEENHNYRKLFTNLAQFHMMGFVRTAVGQTPDGHYVLNLVFPK